MANPLSTLARWFVPQPEDYQERSISDFPSFEEQMHAIWVRQGQPRPWRTAGIQEALGVPAVFSAVSLIANTVGMFSLEAYRQGLKLAQPDTPRIVQRPNPFTIPRDFFRDTAYSMATRGEAWWWIAARDIDDVPLSLYPMPAQEVVVEANDRNPLRPTITWRGREMRNQDVRQITYLQEPGQLRGYGPLQKCGAAISVAVEAQEWAANFFAGSTPSIIGETDMDLDVTDMEKLDQQWNEKPSNLPRWVDNGLKVKDFGVDPQKAQFSDARRLQNGEVASMFRIPGSLIGHTEQGSSLTYTNNEQEYTDFLKGCLEPIYLEPIEQTFGDLLTRATTVQFNVDAILRADIKTRFEVYESGIAKSGVLTVEEARQAEGLAPGGIETAPVPLALPQAIPSILPYQQRSHDGRCVKCSKRLADVAPQGWRTTCPRCGEVNVA